MAVKQFDFKKGGSASNSTFRNNSSVLNMISGGAATPQQYSTLPIELLDTHPEQTHYSMDESELEWLANSISEKGVLQPIAVRSTQNGRYEILAGHRRTEGARRAGLSTIPAMVYVGLDDAGATYIFHATNLGSRSALKPSEKAYAYSEIERVLTEKNMLGVRTTAAIAEETAESARTIQRYKKLLNLPEEVVNRIDEGNFPLTAVDNLTKLSEITISNLAEDLSENEEQVVTKFMIDKLIEKENATLNSALTKPQIGAVFRPKKEKKEKSVKEPKSKNSFKLDFEPFAKYFSKDVTKEIATQNILNALEMWSLQQGLGDTEEKMEEEQGEDYN